MSQRFTEKNQNIEVSRATVNCDGTAKECSTDIIIEYVNPDGEIKTNRIHCH